MRAEAALLQQDLLPVTVLRLVSDDRLVESVRAGSERAFEALFDRHRRPVLAFCRHMLGSSADAEDAVQHTFLAAYRDLMHSEKPIALRPWLYTIARYRCLSMLRGRRERPSEDLPDRGIDNLASQVDLREDVRTTFADLARLPDDQRAALILAELGDVSHEQIARILGCHRDKVKALVFQARASLTADRTARETPCADIRAQLATAGGALRHTNLRRHVRECPGCRAYRGEVRARPRIGLLLPAFGLKRLALGAVTAPGGAGAAFTAGALGGTVATALVVVGIAGSATPSEPSAGADGAPRPRPFAAALFPASSRSPAEQRSARGKPAAVVWGHAFRPAAGVLQVTVDAGEGGPQLVTRVDAHGAPAVTNEDKAPEAASEGADPAPPTTAPGGRDNGDPAARAVEPNGRGPAAQRAPHAQPRGRGTDKPDDVPATHRGRNPAEGPKAENPGDPPKTQQPGTPEKAAEPAKPDKAAEPPNEHAAPEKPSTAATAMAPEASGPPEHAGSPEPGGPPSSNKVGFKADHGSPDAA